MNYYTAFRLRSALTGQMLSDVSGVSILVSMKENEIPIVAGPRTEYTDALVSALHEEHIPARIVLIGDVDPVNRPDWACTPGDEVYVVVPSDRRGDALELGVIGSGKFKDRLATKETKTT